MASFLAVALVISSAFAASSPPAVGQNGTALGASLAATVSLATAPFAFHLSLWEAGALSEGLAQRAEAALLLSTKTESEGRSTVLHYYGASADVQRLSNELDAVLLRQDQERESAVTVDLRSRLAGAEKRLTELAGEANAVISAEMDSFLSSQGIYRGPINVDWSFRFPPLKVDVTPPVFFRYSQVPLLLVVAPRDRIAVLRTDFLTAKMSLSEIEGVETQVDRQGVSSVVLPIGGFAAYPSMIPFNPSLRQDLQVIAHEWVHHYLAFKPLGWQYFSSYSLRTINETVADIAGKEIGEAVYADRYASLLSPSNRLEVGTSGRGGSNAFNFAAAMTDVRRGVEAFLARGDLAEADRYMAERKDFMAQNGYHLRKLNTAYLTFHGAYAGAGNPYEAPLRQLRERSGSLAGFLSAVAAIDTEEALARLVLPD